MKKLLNILIGAGALITVHTQASLVTFDDVSVEKLAAIQGAYDGLSWNNFYILNEAFRPGTGFVPGTVSGVNSAFNGNNTPAEIDALAGGKFTFNSAYFTAAYAPGESLKIDGYSNGTLIYTTTFSIDPTAAKFVTFNWANLDSVKFTTLGNSFMVMDNLTFNQSLGSHGPLNPVSSVPEPSTWITGAGMGLIALGSLVRKLRR